MTRFLRTSLRRLGLAGCVLLTLGASVAVGDSTEAPLTVYQWTDANGIYRYTPDLGNVPRFARESVVTIQAGEAPPSTDPVYFKPDPKAPVITVPSPSPEGDASSRYRPPATGDQWGEYDARIREVETRIAEYEEALKTMVSDPDAGSDTEVTPELREIAQRLPQLQAELAALYRGRSDPDAP
jgi:hypothetical protein